VEVWSTLSGEERNHNFVRIKVKNTFKTKDPVPASHLSYRKFVFRAIKIHSQRD
jgi:hypothetical protein